MIPTLVDMMTGKMTRNGGGYHAQHAYTSSEEAEEAAMAAKYRVARTSSIDINAGMGGASNAGLPFKTAFERLQRRTKSVSTTQAGTSSSKGGESYNNASSSPSTRYQQNGSSKLVWRDRAESARGGKGYYYNQSRRTRNILMGSIAGLCLLYILYTGLGSSRDPSSPLASLRRVTKINSRKENCANPFTTPGKFHVDYTEPLNSVWQVDESSSPSCSQSSVPQYMQDLRVGNFQDLEWMQNKTILLYGDSIERDHVSLFCTLLGRDVEVIKGNHKLAVTSGSNAGVGSLAADAAAARLVERRQKDRSRSSRIALKGMQESTLPRVCFIEELNFMVANLYHFGLDEQDYWKTLDQFHPPGSVEERLEAHVHAFIQKLRQSGRDTAPDLIEVGSGMYDLARWAKQDIAGQRNTEENLSDERLRWYRSRVNKVMDAVVKGFPNAVKIWRAPTLPEDRAAELDYFNDRFGHSAASVTPHFPLNRVRQIDTITRELVKPYSVPAHQRQSSSQRPNSGSSPGSSLGLALSLTPGGAKKAPIRPPGWVNRAITNDFVYNPWSNLVEGYPAHQLDRLHGGDLASPATVLWADMLLWHLKQGVSP